MKLIEVLARELESWAGDVAAITQDAVTGELYDHWHCKLSGGNERSVSLLAEDAGPAHDGGSGSSVTRAQWEEAKNSMYLSFDHKPTWSGEGRPVAGVKLEWKEITGFQWVEAELLFITDSSVILQRSDGFEWQMPADKVVFRPIATPEQISEDQRREAAINEMVSLAPMLDKGWARKVCQAIYDAGYRKPE